jgi:methylmalonyl-CoA/ethylmalonyl-CoA epimerase
VIRKIDHVGIVVRNIDEALNVFSNIFGFEVVESITGPQQEFKLVLISKGNASLELIEPINPEGSISNFLKQRGGGLHHIALDVDDIEQELESLRAMSVSLVNKEPESILSARVAFIHPSSTGGVLIELIQKV